MASISHNREDESLEVMARWFRTLSLEQRMQYLCEVTDLILENNPGIVKQKHVEPVKGRIRVLSLPGL